MGGWSCAPGFGCIYFIWSIIIIFVPRLDGQLDTLWRDQWTHKRRIYIISIIYTAMLTVFIHRRWVLYGAVQTDMCASSLEIYYHTMCGKLQFQLSVRWINKILFRLISFFRPRRGYCEWQFSLITLT